MIPPINTSHAVASHEAARVQHAQARLLASQDGATPQAAEAARSFESVFLGQVIGSMFEGVRTDGMFGGGHAESMWRSILVEHIANAAAERGGLGIADAVLREIVSMSPEQHT